MNVGEDTRHQVGARSPGVDLDGIPLSRAPHIFRRNTRFAGTVIRPGYQFFSAIWGPDFRASITIVTNMFKQIKQIRITLMTMFKVDPSPPKERQSVSNDAELESDCCLVYSALDSSINALGCVLGRCDSRLPILIIAMSTVSFPRELTIAGYHVLKTQASEMTFWNSVRLRV